MRGNLWTVLLAAFGVGILFRGLSVAVPASAAESTQAVSDVLTQIAPFSAQLLTVAALGALVIIAIRAT